MKPNSWGVWCVYKSKKSPPLACKHNPKELLLAWCNIKRCVFSSRVVQYIIIVIRFVSQCLLETNETQLYVIICFCGVWDSGRGELPDSLSSERFRNNSIFKLTSTTIAHTMVWDLIKHVILKTLVPKVSHCFCNRHELNSSDFRLCIFIQRDLQAFRLYIYCQYVCSLGIEPTTFALLTQCSTTEPQEHFIYIERGTRVVSRVLFWLWPEGNQLAKP